MIEFESPLVSDRNWVNEKAINACYMNMEYSFGIMYLWQDSYNTRIANVDGFLTAQSVYSGGGKKQNIYLFPVGDGDVKPVIEKLRKYCHEQGESFALYGVTDCTKATLESLYPDEFNYKLNRTTFEYIYNVEDMAYLAGKKYHSKRNHITRFEREYYGWSYETITEENLVECMEMCSKWYTENDVDNSPGLQQERHAINLAMNDFFSLGFEGGLIRHGGKVVAFTFGERLNPNTFILHVEKAFYYMTGGYAVINREFAKNHLLGKYDYVNREDDVGDENIRKAKLSYRPAILLEKYIVTEK